MIAGSGADEAAFMRTARGENQNQNQNQNTLLFPGGKLFLLQMLQRRNVLLPVFMSTHLFKCDGRYLTMKMEHHKTQPGGVGPEHLVFITACQTSFFLSTWGLGTGGSSVSFSLCTMPSKAPVDHESITIPACVCDSPRPRHWPTSWCAGRIAHSWCHTPGRFPEDRCQRTDEKQSEFLNLFRIAFENVLCFSSSLSNQYT